MRCCWAPIKWRRRAWGTWRCGQRGRSLLLTRRFFPRNCRRPASTSSTSEPPRQKRRFRPSFFKAFIRVWVLVVALRPCGLHPCRRHPRGPGALPAFPPQMCWADWDEQKSLWQRSERTGKGCVPRGKKDSVPRGHPCSASAAFCRRLSPEGRDPCLPSAGLPKAQLSPIHLSPVTVIKSDLQWGKNSIFRIAGY